MEDRIITQLKKFKSIGPDAHFAAGSRRTILALRKEQPVFTWPNFRFVGTLAGVLAVVAASVFMFSGNSATKAFASPEMLNQEFDNMNINIELQEISYRQNVSQTISSAITEISDNKLSHLNQDILKSESGGLDLNVPDSGLQIDKLLDKVVQ